VVVLCLVVLGQSVAAHGQDATGSAARLRKRPVRLWPPSDPKEDDGNAGRAIELGGWTYRAVKSSQPRDGVPWELIVTPAGENAVSWRKGAAGRRHMLPVAAVSRKGDGTERNHESIPVVEIPDVLWKQWMAADLQDVAGIHFHEYVTDGATSILYTVHKVPPDDRDGNPPVSYSGRRGTRIEATLLAPVMFNLDQTVIARKDPLEKSLIEGRIQHEVGHAQVSQRVLLEVMRGPQDWNLEYCTGRRSRLAYYWKREQIGRSWNGYRGGVGKLLTLRTSVVLVPPTRWSVLLPIPPERVTQQQIQAFNDAIALLGPQFAAVDHDAQERFHAQHGAFEREARP